MTTSKLMKGLLGASAFVALSTGTAFAQVPNNFTPADTDVSNTFTLDYDVGGVEQPPITNDGNPGNDAPTVFKVDRLVNVTVASSGVAGTFAPGSTDAVTQFSVRNDGNDSHTYLLDFEEAVSGTGNDNFDTLASTSGDRIVYYPDTNGNGVLDGTEGDAANAVDYDPADDTTWPVLGADDSIIVRVVRNIPASAADGEEAIIYLYADTRDSADPSGTPIVADPIAGNETNVTENVLIDADGPAGTGNDDDTDGAHSAQGAYVIVAADITATKDVFVFDADYDGTCDAIGAAYTPPAPSTDAPAGPVPNNGYHRPDACVEYFITVRNDGSADATDIDLSDILSEHLIFESARAVGFLTGGTLSTIAADTSCNGDPVVGSPTCNVTLTGATLAGKAAPGDAPVEGHLVIRATIK